MICDLWYRRWQTCKANAVEASKRGDSAMVEAYGRAACLAQMTMVCAHALETRV